MPAIYKLLGARYAGAPAAFSCLLAGRCPRLVGVSPYQLLHFASQRICGPQPKQLRPRPVFKAFGLAQRHSESIWRFDLGHRLIPAAARVPASSSCSAPMRKASAHPIMIRGLPGRHAAEIGRNVLGAYLAPRRGDRQATAGN